MRSSTKLLPLLVALLAGCGDGTEEPTGGTTTPPPAGEVGGACLEGDSCAADGVYCIAGTCRAATCTLGEAGCSCRADLTCDLGADGRWMVCDGGRCEPSLCPEGSLGCACLGGGTCNDGLACDLEGANPACQIPGCEPGDEACGCNPDRTCGQAADGSALVCDGSRCVRPTCPIGAVGCACRADFGCDAGLACGDDSRCGRIDCPSGRLGCGCLAGDTCSDSDLFCAEDGTCQAQLCPQGQEGCGCFANLTCGLASDGLGVLRCNGGVCELTPCIKGTDGCLCDDGDACQDGLECASGLCVPDTCDSGEPGCPCLPSGRCGEDLVCDGGLCIESTGHADGPCFPNGTCHTGLRCAEDVCVSCAPGSAECSCFLNGSCQPGLVCTAGRCLEEVVLDPEPPVDPVCYSPCTGDVDLGDAGIVACSPEGLAAYCPEDTSCVEGSCVPEGAGPRTCASEIECPDFQTCIDGQCYSNCRASADCAGGLTCHRHVCRTPCMASGDACEPGSTCVTREGEIGACLPVPPPGGDPPPGVDGDIGLEPFTVAFTNSRTRAAVMIINASDEGLDFTVRKLSHVEYTDSGVLVETELPLFWATMGAADPPGPADTARSLEELFDEALDDVETEPAQELTFFIEPRMWRIIVIDDAANEDLSRWEGVLAVESPRLGYEEVRLSYTSVPEGRWAGSVYYFGNFRDQNLDGPTGWLADRDSPSRAASTQNAFIRRWVDFRNNAISLDEWLAIANATASGSWSYPSVDEVCERSPFAEVPGAGLPNGACYLFDNPQGFSIYSNNLNALAVPSGVVELPMSMTLRPAGGDPSEYEGRIETNAALQYAGYPGVSLSFANDPMTCTRGGSACLVDVVDFAADIAVGARYPTMPGDPDCTDGYQVVDLPWFVQGFTAETTFNPTTGLRYRHECRDSLLPLGEIEAELNRSLAGANPIPDGRPRVRHLELVDGMLINGNTLFIIFREWYEEFLGADAPSAGDEPVFSAYGMMLLSRQPGSISDAGYVGHDVEDDREPAFEPGLAVECDPGLVEEVLGPGTVLDTADEGADLAWGLITGMPYVPVADPLEWDPESATDEQVHYFCEDTGTFDNIVWDGEEERLIPCPPGSRVTFFTTVGLRHSTIQELSCQQSAAVAHLPSDIQQGYRLPDGSRCNPTDPTDPDYSTSPLCRPVGGLVNLVNQEDTVQVIDRGTCQSVLNQWVAEERYQIRLNPAWQCEDPELPGEPLRDGVLCDAVRIDPARQYDLRRGRLFYPAAEVAAVFPPIDAEIEAAFRYRVRFRNRDGTGLGFVPSQCAPDSDAVPYCYNPPAIEGIRDRVDCLTHVYTSYFEELGDETLGLLGDFLATNFSYVSAYDRCRQLGGSIDGCSLVDPVIHYDGFERLYTELLVMQGDEALTRSLASRFDLAGTQLAHFQGSLLEPGGINLTGGAGYEMVLLYRAAQYYELALDRFYRLSPILWEVGEPQTDFVTAATVTSYMERLVLASTKLTRAYNEISRRYQRFNRPDLARLVIERGYTRAYLESIALTRMMQRVIRAVDINEVPQVQQVIDDTLRRYRIALLDMADAYQDITNDVSFFGLPPDYIPFPGLTESDPNAVRLLLDRAAEAVEVATALEEDALASTRSFDVDAVQFQAELVRVQQEYENQLGDLCGTFEGTDGNIYPAIPRYLPFFDGARTHAQLPPMVDDPCGLVENGDITQARRQIEAEALGMEGIITRYQNVLDEIDLVRQETAARCGLILSEANWEAAQQSQILDLQNQTSVGRLLLSEAQRAQERRLRSIGELVGLAAACSPSISASVEVGVTVTPPAPVPYALVSASATMDASGCVSTMTTTAITSLMIAVTDGNARQTETAVAALESHSRIIDANLQFRRNTRQCDFVRLEATGQIQRLWLQLKQLEIQLLQQQYSLDLAEGELTGLSNQARRLAAQQEDSEQLLINLEAARNDPNVRIYTNAAVIRADRAFYNALRAVYRATRVFEYYSSQSYARLDELFLVRMVDHGETNLADYLIALENAFFDFEEEFGVPDTRVAVLSLRDDILGIPRFDADMVPLSQGERVLAMREALTDVSRLDRSGYIAIPFSTAVEDLSPVTRNHKLIYIEAELIGSDLGDGVARVYLRQRGTGAVRGVGGDKRFYAFPELTAVLNPFLNGARLFDPDVYRNVRLRDRPFANTHWELVLNLRDEAANLDINVESLSDIRLYLYYTDFTEL